MIYILLKNPVFRGIDSHMIFFGKLDIYINHYMVFISVNRICTNADDFEIDMQKITLEFVNKSLHKGAFTNDVI